MHKTNSLRGVDLNLLVVLEALLSTQHVSRAATQLNMSQPAVSHALNRLRHLFDDPLLLRKNGKLVASPVALALRPELEQTLDGLRRLLVPAPFDPATEQRTFHLAMSDYGSSVVLPPLLRALRKIAPHVRLKITQLSRDAAVRAVLDGELDLALGVFEALPRQIDSQRLFVENFACLLDGRTLDGAAELSLATYLARPHLLVAMQNATSSEIDRALETAGHSREITAILPHWGTALALIEGTDMILTVAERSLSPLKGHPHVRIHTVPFDIPSFDYIQIWHERRRADPAHTWLREQIAEATASDAPIPPRA